MRTVVKRLLEREGEAPTEPRTPVSIPHGRHGVVVPECNHGSQFVQFLVPEGDGLTEYARQVIDAMPAEERRFREVHRAKAEIHTWLAWQEQPGLPLGLAIATRYLDAGCAEATRFVDWLRRLYELPDAPPP